MNAVDTYWLGDRDHIPNDFDGRLRQIKIVRSLVIPSADQKLPDDQFLLVSVDPAFPLKDGTTTDELALREARGRTDLNRLDISAGGSNPWWRVYLAVVVDRTLLDTGVVPVDVLEPVGSGEVSRRPELLPRSQAELFAEGQAALQKFVEREGTSNVPEQHFEGEFPLGLWVGNIRLVGRQWLTHEQAQLLQSMPGWTWKNSTANELG